MFVVVTKWKQGVTESTKAQRCRIVNKGPSPDLLCKDDPTPFMVPPSMSSPTLSWVWMIMIPETNAPGPESLMGRPNPDKLVNASSAGSEGRLRICNKADIWESKGRRHPLRR